MLRLTVCRSHGHVTDGTVEQHQRQTLLLQLIDRRLENSVASSFEVAARYDFKRITDVDDERTGLVRYIIPLLIAAPDLKARNRHRE